MTTSFKHFLTENSDEKMMPIAIKAAETIFAKCQPFIKTSGVWFDSDGYSSNNKRGCLYRGIRNRVSGPTTQLLSSHAANLQRKPVDMPPVFHTMLDDYLNEHFGFRYRSGGLFCSPVRAGTASYGNPYIVFPIGKYEYVYSEKIRDAFVDLAGDKHGETASSRSHARLFEEIVSDLIKSGAILRYVPEGTETSKRIAAASVSEAIWADMVDTWLEQKMPYQNTGLPNLLGGGKMYVGEVIVKCDKYFLLNLSSMSEDVYDAFVKRFNQLQSQDQK